MVQEIHVGDVGTRFLVTFKDEDANGVEQLVDIGPASLREITFQSPRGKVRVVTGTLLTDGSDGQLFYDTRYGSELDEAAVLPGHPLWKVQGEVHIGSGMWRSSVPTFEVHPNIGLPRPLILKPDPSSLNVSAPVVTLLGP